MTYCSLLAVVLAFEIGDVPLVSIAVTDCALLLVRILSSDIHYCNPWIVATVDKITALILQHYNYH